jgi:hypothetical protein
VAISHFLFAVATVSTFTGTFSSRALHQTSKPAHLHTSKPKTQLTWSIRSARKAKKGWWTASTSCPHFNGTSPVITFANADLKRDAIRTMAKFVADLKEGPTDEGKPPYQWEMDMSPAMSVANRNLISLNFADYEGTWGAHPNTEFECYSYGLVHGEPKQLKLNDLFLSDTDGAEQVNRIAMAYLKKNQASFVEDGTVKTLPKETLESFIITPTGITLLIATDIVTSHAEGPQIIDIPFKKLKGLDPRGPLKGLVRVSSQRSD